MNLARFLLKENHTNPLDLQDSQESHSWNLYLAGPNRVGGGGGGALYNRS